MTGNFAFFRSNRLRLATATLAVATACLAQGAFAQGLKWVEASDDIAGNQYPQNLFPAANPADPLSTVLNANGQNSGNDQVNNDQGWTYRDEGTAQNTSLGLTATVYESVQENSPELLVRATAGNGGIVANTAYNVYVAYWSEPTGGDWGVRAGATSNPGANPIFNRSGANGATAGIFAGSAIWTTLPQNNPGTNPQIPGGPPNPDNPSPFINTTNSDATPTAPATVAPQTTQRMYLGLIGTVMSNASAQLNVYVDDIGNTGDVNQRAWLDGLAIIPATVTTPIVTTASIDRTTRALTFTNPTGVALNIKSYTVNSAAGSLDSTGWTEIATGQSNIVDAGWAITAPASPSTSTTALAEQDNALGSVATIPALGGTLNLGPVWVSSPIEDVTVTLTLTDGSQIDVTPTFGNGNAIVNGDFNGDGSVNVTDYMTLRTNFGTAAATLAANTQVTNYKLGDMSRDNLINRTDFIAFRDAYLTANPQSSWEALIASVPEPTSGVLAILSLGTLCSIRRRRSPAKETVDKAHHEKAIMTDPSKLLRGFVALACAIAAGLAPAAASAQAIVDITGAVGRHATSGAVIPVTNPTPGTFSAGDGTALSADNTTVWAALATPITVVNGQEAVLRGRVQFVGVPITGDAFRFGMFDGKNFTGAYDPAIEPLSGTVPSSRSTTQPDGWLGFLASASSGGGGNGALEARNPAATGNTQFISNAGGGDIYQLANLGTGPGQSQTPGNRVIRLAVSPSNGNFGGATNTTYDFEMVLGRYGFENTITAKLTSTNFNALPGDLEPNQIVDGADVLLLQRGTPTAAGLTNIENNFGKTGQGTPAYNWTITATASPSQDTIPTMITNEIDRVGFLLANGMDTSQANFTGVQVEVRNIQSMILDVNTVSGAVSMRNASGASFDVAYYELTSVNGNLNTGGYIPLDNAEGGDAVGVGWDVLGTPTANLLAEGNLVGKKTIASGSPSVSLGTAFNTATTLAQRDTNFFFTTTDGITHRGVVNYNTTSTIGAVPEPASIGLALVGLAGLASRRRRAG